MSIPQSHNATETTVPDVISEQLSTPNKTPIVSAQQLLDALDTQIKFEAESQRNEGWTRWAIWGAIAALVWIGTDLWWQPSLSVPRMVGLSLLVFVLWKFLEEGIWVLLPTARIEVGPTRFWLAADTIHPLRPTMAITAAQYLLVISALTVFKFPGQWFLWTYALVAFGFSAIMLCFGTRAIGVPARISPKAAINVGTYIQLVCLAGAGWQIAMVIYPNYGGYSLADVRLSLVLNAGTFLISRLVVAVSSEHRLSKLTQLRQHLAFGRISLPDACERTEALLTGVTLEKLFSPLVQPILDERAKLQARLAEAKRALDKADGLMEERPEEALRLLDLMGSPPSVVAQQLKQNKWAWGRFAGQAIGFAFFSKESKSEVKMITDGIRTQLADVDIKLNECYHRYNSLKAEACRLAAVMD